MFKTKPAAKVITPKVPKIELYRHNIAADNVYFSLYNTNPNSYIRVSDLPVFASRPATGTVPSVVSAGIIYSVNKNYVDDQLHYRGGAAAGNTISGQFSTTKAITDNVEKIC